MDEEKLPLPEKDLPLPEKEIPARAENKGLLSSKWLGIGIIVIVLILGVSGAYLLGQNNATKTPTQKTVAVASPTPTPDPTANWKTYINTQYGYSIKYPSDVVDFKQDTFFLIGDSGRKDTAGGYGPNLQVLWRDYKPAAEASKEELSTRELKPTTINGYPAVEVVPSIDPSFAPFAEDFDYYISPLSNDKSVRITFSAQKYSKTVSTESISKMRNIAIQMLSTFKFNDQTSANQQESVLKIPEYGVQIKLSEDIKDAYYINTTASKGYVYLKVHSLDSEPQCLKDDSSTAALSKVGKDDINPMTGEKYSASFTKGATIGDYFYYIDLAQYSCAESTDGKAKLEKVRSAFNNAEIIQ